MGDVARPCEFLGERKVAQLRMIGVADSEPIYDQVSLVMKAAVCLDEAKIDGS
jgi:hypothetical protein